MAYPLSRIGRNLLAINRSRSLLVPRFAYRSSRAVYNNKPDFDFTDDQLKKIDQLDFTKKLLNNPEMQHKFQDVVGYLIENKFIVPGEQPSMSQVFKMMVNKDVRTKLADCR
jgi:hypothetical protein